MKTITRSNIYLPMAAIILTAALAVPAAAQQQVPFMGAMQGHDTDIGLTNNLATVLTVGTGIATHMGQFSFTQTWTVDVTTGILTGTAQWFAANGDSISTTIKGLGQFIEPSLVRIVEVHTITGGTGRFAGAQGSFTLTKLASPVTFLTSGSFDGTITPPGAAH
jgi:EamA domain-containing membrane protein RarD